MEKYHDEIQLKDILITLSEYRVFLLKQKLAIIAFSFLLSLLGFIYAFSSDSKYNAELTFIVELDQGGSASLGAMSGIANQFGFDIGGGESSTFSQSNVMELLKSRGVVERTLMKTAKVDSRNDLLIEHYLEINKIKEDWGYSNNFRGISFHDNSSYMHDSIRGLIWKEIIDNNLFISLQSDEANILMLSYTSFNEEFAKEFAENLIGQMSKMYISHKTAQANNTLSFLKNRADSVFVELELAEQEFAKVKDINQRIVKASGRLKELQLMRRVEVLNAMYLEIIKNLEISKITLLNNTPIINIIDKPILPLDEDRQPIAILALLGFILGAFLSICYFVCRKLFKDVLGEAA